MTKKRNTQKNQRRVLTYARSCTIDIDHSGEWLSSCEPDPQQEHVPTLAQVEPEPDTILPLFARAIERSILDMDREDDQPELHFLDDDDDWGD